MSNEKFEDMAVLSTLAQLREGHLLNNADAEALGRELKSEWGKKVFAALQSESASPEAEDRELLQRFSSTFAA